MTLPPNVDSKGGQKAVLPRLLSRASSLALLYLLAGALWVLLSDSLLARMVSDPSQMIQWQLFKGLFFIAASALLLWSERSRSDHRVQQAEEQLQKHLEESNAELDRVRKQLHAILENAPIAFAMRGLDNRYLLTNRQWEEFMGVSGKDAIGKTPYDLFPKPLADNLTAALAGVWEKPEGIIEELPAHLNGRDYHLMRASFPLYDDEGKAYAGIALITDISRRKAVEESLRQAEERFHAVFQSVGVGINLVAPSGHYIDSNPAFQKMVGYNEKELAGKHYSEITYPPDLVEDERITQQITEGAIEVAEEEKRYVRADGSLVWTRLLISAIRNSDGSLATYVTVVEEISARKEAEAQRRRTQAELERLVAERTAELQHANDILADAQRIAHVGNWNADLATNRLYFSAETYRIFGYEPDAFDGTHQTFLATVHPDDRDLAEWMRQEVLQGLPMDYEHRIIRPDGQIRTVHERGYVVRDQEGNAVQIFGTVQDISERKVAEAEVQRLNHDLEARVAERTAHLQQEIAERVRAEAAVHELNATLAAQAQSLAEVNKELETFTYSVSHDLKAPLRGIDGYSRLLLEDYTDRLDGDGQYFLTAIRSATTQMAQLIDDLLSYSRLERRNWAANQVEVVTLVDQVLFQMQPARLYPNTTVKTAITPATVTCDADALALALRNLLDNALKFSAQGSAPLVEIGSELCGNCEQSAYILFVRDNGVGFDMQYQDRIFDIFQRLHRSEEYPGTGIGLAMVRKALQRMNGRVWAESRPGQGATFTMEIPFL